MNTDKLLNEIFKEFLKEVHSNPSLKSHIEVILEKYFPKTDKLSPKTDKPSTRTRRRKLGIFDPMMVYRENPENLKSRLIRLNIEELKDIVAEQGMDRSKLAMKWKDKDRLIQLIVTTVETRVHKGDAFRAPNTKMDSISSVRSVDVPEHQ